MKECLFHGSNTSGTKVLEPRISLEFKKLVYATDDLAYALVRAGRQLDVIREEYQGKGKPIELTERYPNAFEQMFNCSGYVYLLDRDDFTRNPETGEYISTEPVRVQGCIPVDNVLRAMWSMKDSYDFHWYYDVENLKDS